MDSSSILIGFLVAVLLFQTVSGQNEAAGEKASGKPIWEVGSSKVCGDRLCSEIEQDYSDYIAPEWVRNIFIWYGQNQISEDEFINALQFLIDEGIIKVKP